MTNVIKELQRFQMCIGTVLHVTTMYACNNSYINSQCKGHETDICAYGHPLIKNISTHKYQCDICHQSIKNERWHC